MDYSAGSEGKEACIYYAYKQQHNSAQQPQTVHYQ